MKSAEQRLAQKFQELEEQGKRATVVEIIESKQSVERKLAAAEHALGGLESSKKRLAEAARRAFKLAPEQAEAFAEPRSIDPYWKAIKEMR